VLQGQVPDAKRDTNSEVRFPPEPGCMGTQRRTEVRAKGCCEFCALLGTRFLVCFARVAADATPLARGLAEGDTDIMSSAKVKRVLLYRLGSLGDHLVALPSYRLVQRAFPEAERRLLTNIPVMNKAAAATAVLDGSGLVDGYLTYVVGERGPLALLRLAWMIRRWKPDVLVYLAGARGIKAARRDRIFFRLCGIRRQIGLPLTEDLQDNRSEGQRNGVPYFEQEGRRLARCVAELGDAHVDDPASWSPGLTEEERQAGKRLVTPLRGAPFFAFSLGTKAQSNQWGGGAEGTARWQQLLSKLAAEWPGYGLAVIGAEDERESSESVITAWRAVPGAGPALNLCGSAKPRVSAAVIEQSVMFFGHDSGPAHMAASVGTPVLGIYSARMMPGQWIPNGEHVRVVFHWVECGGCLLETCVLQGKKCILSIGVEEAWQAAQEHLRKMQAHTIRELPLSEEKSS
jgi:heptosyltransferase III